MREEEKTTMIMEGQLKDMALIRLLQDLHTRGVGADVRVQTPRGSGIICLRKGTILHAVFQGQDGEDALKLLLEEKEGTFSVTPSTQPAPKTIGRPTHELLLNISRKLGVARKEEVETQPEMSQTDHPSKKPERTLPPDQWFPKRPESVEETGLKFDFLAEMILRTLYVRGTMTGEELEDALKIPYFGVLEHPMKFLRDEAFVEVRRGVTIVELHWEFLLTQKGLERARLLMDRLGYVGPAPVPFEQYFTYVKEILPTPQGGLTLESLKKALQGLVFKPSLYHHLGPAIFSGLPTFLYGPPGTGKTSIAERIAGIRPGKVWIPYALLAHGQVIRLFDPMHHVEDPTPRSSNDKVDERWVEARRPFVMVGGELTLHQLELQFEEHSKTYVAPLHMKANGGVFLMDDFGRQRVSPRDLLNRWIVPLEKREDFFSLRTGEQVRIPFKVQIVFSTNLDPKDLVDEAFLRRIPYRVYVGPPEEKEFKEIFRLVCQAYKVPYDEEAVDYLIQTHYRPQNRPFRGSHPRDLVIQVKVLAQLLGREPRLDPDLLDLAAENYLSILDAFDGG